MSNGKPENPGRPAGVGRQAGDDRRGGPKHGQTAVSDRLPTAQDADDDGKVWLISGRGDGAEAELVPLSDVAAHANMPNKFWADPKAWTPPEPELEEEPEEQEPEEPA